MNTREMKFKKTGDLIRKFRKQKGMTQSDLSDAIGYGNKAQNISNIERGMSGIPKTKIEKIAKVLSIPKNKIVNTIIRQQRDSLS